MIMIYLRGKIRVTKMLLWLLFMSIYTHLCLFTFLFKSSQRLQIPHNTVITRKQPAATAYSSLVVANCLHVRTCTNEVKKKMLFGTEMAC